ncbi:MAG: hypothetical protein KH972_05315 [Peptostreptococcaceae bacterium]|uniref:Uncharacterized protein n=1 Tax=Criibacterium bergeronii TaxID=1871336 RepID=A0A371ING1_9FIRM|nr:hypothetical protein [Criibacterium bergeronii]MBS6063271.1 hypothetical protein [Peptostreptococcaceae bacterium]RDY22017.1 hypothetical protein BBG48_001345 [Criibacterium bergeronii]
MIESYPYTYDKDDAASQKELLQIKTDIGFWSFNELVSVDEEKLKNVLGLEIDDDGNFYDPLSKDIDLDNVPDRYDADFRDSKVQNMGDMDKKEKSSVLEKLSEYKEKVQQEDRQPSESIDRNTKQKEVI